MAHLHVLMGAETIRTRPAVRKIGLADLRDALKRGIADFLAMPTHAVFLCLIYPIVGVILARLTLGYDLLPLLFPLAAGFALVGPFAALGFYELSRRREQGLPVSWQDAFDVLHSPSRDAIAALALLLLVIFAIWIAVAQAIYIAYFGYAPAASIPHFADPSLHHARRLDAHHRRQSGGVPVRRAGVDHQRGLVSAAARPRRRRGGSGVDLGARGRRQPDDHGGVGTDRGRATGGGRLAAVFRPGRGGPGAGTFDLASLSQGGGAGLEISPAICTSGVNETSLCSAISSSSLHRRRAACSRRSTAARRARTADLVARVAAHAGTLAAGPANSRIRVTGCGSAVPSSNS